MKITLELGARRIEQRVDRFSRLVIGFEEDDFGALAQVQLGKATETISSQVVATGSIRGSTDRVSKINKISLELGIYRIDAGAFASKRRTVTTRPQGPSVRRSCPMAIGSLRGSLDQVKEINKISLELVVYRID